MLKRLFSLFLLLLCLPLSVQAVEGMDVSVFQGEINFVAARQDGIEAVYIRASYGPGGVDSRFVRNCAGAETAGLPFGLYHYLEAQDPDGARREAEHFVSLIRSKGYFCRPALDFENYRGLDAGQATAVALAFLERVEELTGQRPMIYADGYAVAAKLEGPVSAYPLWLAQWDVNTPSLAGSPWQEWTGWQYTDVGRVEGIEGYVDRDRFTDAIFLREEETVSFPYTVRPGDTLWCLSRRFGTTVERLVELNDIENPNLIYVNQILRIPGKAPIEKSYIVQPGDTLCGISRLYGVTVNQLVQLNGIQNPNLIYPGQVLRVP